MLSSEISMQSKFSPSCIQVKFLLLYIKHIASCASLDKENSSWPLPSLLLKFSQCHLKPWANLFSYQGKLTVMSFSFFSPQCITGYQNKTKSTVMVNLMLRYTVFIRSLFLLIMSTAAQMKIFITVSSLVSSSGIYLPAYRHPFTKDWG